ncbi:ribonuclease H-like domain-containing protein [Tanacetum coccineum]
MAMRLLVLISPKWSAITFTRGDILEGSAELQKIKTLLGIFHLRNLMINKINIKVTFIGETLNDARNKNNKISNNRVEDDKETTLEAMKMEHYLAHTDYPIWEVIQKGNGPISVSTDTHGVIKVLLPRTAKEILAKERERKARTTLLMALPEDHLAKFHKMTDEKEIWDAIKSRFEGLHKGYDRFQSFLSQLEIHGAGVSIEDANQNFLRSLPSTWSQVSLIMKTKPGVDNLSFDDLYNNLSVFESNVKGTTTSSSNTQNVAFVSSESTNSTNDVSTAYGASPSSGHNSQRENSSSYTNDLMYSFFANQSSGPQLNHEDLEQIDEFNLEEMDFKWQVAMISMRLKKFYKKTGRKLQFDAKEPVGFDKTKVECYNCYKTGHFARECRLKGNQDVRRRDAGNFGYKAKDNGRRHRKQKEPNALVTLDGEGIDWTAHAEDEQEDFALMAFSNSGSDTEGVFVNKDSNAEDRTFYDRFVTTDGMLVVPPLMTGIYMPSGPDIEIDEYQFTYGPKQSTPSESDTRSSDFDSFWNDAPIIEEYESDSDDDCMSTPTKEQEQPSFASVNTVINQHTHSHSPKVNKKDLNGSMSKRVGLGYGFTRKASFVCGSFSHLIRDCDFHEKRMAKLADLNKQKVLTITGRIPVNAAGASVGNYTLS